jgi:hypothetical protein
MRRTEESVPTRTPDGNRRAEFEFLGVCVDVAMMPPNSSMQAASRKPSNQRGEPSRCGSRLIDKDVEPVWGEELEGVRTPVGEPQQP